jgi:hypothetical protein
VVSLGVLVAAAMWSLTLGAALYQSLAGGRSSVAGATRARAFSHKGLLGLPLAAQGPVSAALGADNPAYRVRAWNGGFRAVSPAQHLSMGFGRLGVSVSSGTTHVALSLRAVGYGASLTALGQVAPRVEASRVVYAHAGLSEWYANGPLGLEQGFTIPRVPSGHPVGPLTLSMALSGNAYASLTAGGRSVTLSRGGRPALRYTGLTATDARGRVLQSWLQLHAGRILLRVDTRGARYPLRIDPFIQQGEKLTGGGAIGHAGFGLTVALSSDGNTALIGGNADNEGVGAAWVFTRSGSTWTQQGAKLTGGGEIGKGYFGNSVALSSDGNTALIGGGGGGSGAWVFTRSGSTWTQQGEKLTGGGAVGVAGFGASVALSSDGNTALIGGVYDNLEVGAAWVFTRSGSTWTQQGEKLTGGGESGEGRFGRSVALSSDGNTALIGAVGDNSGVGAAWVFTRSGSTWTQQGAKLTGGGGTGGVGFSVALSSDGNTALIGGTGFPGGPGAAWVFTRSGSTWTQQGEKLTGGGESGTGSFGSSVALSSDGNTALIGGWGDNGYVGAAWVFTRSGSTWTQQGEKLTGGGESGEGSFGSSVALSSDGNTALIGGYNDNSRVGAGWVFTNVTSTKAEEEAAATRKHEEEAAATKKHEEEAAAKKHQEEEAAAKKHQEEEAAAKKKAEEEAAAKKKAEEEALAKIASSLAGQIGPVGKTAKIAALLKHGGYAFSFTAPGAGALVISWYLVPKGGHLSASRQPVLIARGAASFSKAGAVKVTIRLTAKGKQLLKHTKQVKLTAKGSFTPAGSTAVVKLKTFTLKQ